LFKYACSVYEQNCNIQVQSNSNIVFCLNLELSHQAHINIYCSNICQKVLVPRSTIDQDIIFPQNQQYQALQSTVPDLEYWTNKHTGHSMICTDVLQDTINDNEILRCYFFSVFVNKWNNSFVTECHLTIYPRRKLCAGFRTSLRWHKTTAIIQNHMTIVRPCDRSNLNTSDSGAELAE